MLLILNLFKRNKEETKTTKRVPQSKQPTRKSNEKIAARKGELGEYKIDIQLDQLPKDSRYLSDLLVKNPRAKSGYSQIDHVVLSPYGVFVIETKNYQGTIYGGKNRKTWLVNGKFKMMNPFVQNYGHIKALQSYLDPTYNDFFISMVSFTKRCKFKIDMDYREIGSNELIVYDIELSDFLHRKNRVLKLQHKEPLLTEQELTIIYNALLKANITDPKARELHKQVLQNNSPEEKTDTRATCTICQKPVSDKVKMYCMSNEKFGGKVYCYECQKGV